MNIIYNGMHFLSIIKSVLINGEENYSFYKPAKDPPAKAPSKFVIWSCCIILLSAKLSSVWIRPFNDTRMWDSEERSFITDSTS